MPTRHRLTDKEKKTQARIERKRVDEHMASFSRPKKPETPLTAKQIRDRKSEELRKKGTPPGLQGLVNVLTQKET